jgi:two-component system, OmpR family, response regulator
MRVLVVEDEPAMAAVLRRGLAENGMAVDVAETGAEASWLIADQPYDAVVLDRGLPDGDGLDLLESWRGSARWVPVLVLTALDAVPDRVAGLDLGADDYLVKPFAFPELLARLRVLCRRGTSPRPAVLQAGDLRLDPATRRVTRGDVPLRLTPREYALLECLLRHPDQVLSKTELVQLVWDYAFDLDSNVVEVHMGNLRRKIDQPFGRQSLETVRGFGYRLRDDDVAP